jgi:hypothetical protein
MKETHMEFGIREGTVLGVIGGIFLLANVVWIARGLQDHGRIDWARNFREEFLDKTAITVIVALLVLLVLGRNNSHPWFI